jgi:hypothetical protein
MPMARYTRTLRALPAMSARETVVDSFVPDADFDPQTMEIIPPTPKQLGSLEQTHPEEYQDGEYVGKWVERPSDEALAAEKLAETTYTDVIKMVKATDDIMDLDTLETLETLDGIGKSRQSVLKAIATRRAQLEG